VEWLRCNQVLYHWLCGEETLPLLGQVTLGGPKGGGELVLRKNLGSFGKGKKGLGKKRRAYRTICVRLQSGDVVAVKGRLLLLKKIHHGPTGSRGGGVVLKRAKSKRGQGSHRNKISYSFNITVCLGDLCTPSNKRGITRRCHSPSECIKRGEVVAEKYIKGALGGSKCHIYVQLAKIGSSTSGP